MIARRDRPPPRWDPPILCQICFREFPRPPELLPWVPATKCPDCYPEQTPSERMLNQIVAEVRLAEDFESTAQRRAERGWIATEQILHPALMEVEKPIIRKPGEKGWAEEESKR